MVALAVGRDPLLLETRSEVLRSAGNAVVSAFSVRQALQLFVSGDFDIVILCHSIAVRDRERLAHAVHSRSPNTPVVVVAAGLSTMDHFADAIVDNEPKRLLQEIPKLLHNALKNYPHECKEA